MAAEKFPSSQILLSLRVFDAADSQVLQDTGLLAAAAAVGQQQGIVVEEHGDVAEAVVGGVLQDTVPLPRGALVAAARDDKRRAPPA